MGNCAVLDCGHKHGKANRKCSLVKVPESFLVDYIRALNRPRENLPADRPRICTCHLEEDQLTKKKIASKEVTVLREDIKPKPGTIVTSKQKLQTVPVRGTDSLQKRKANELTSTTIKKKKESEKQDSFEGDGIQNETELHDVTDDDDER